MIGAGAGIHPSAAVDSAARIGSKVSIGAFAVIGPEVEIGDGCVIGSHVVIEGPTVIGRNNRIHPFAAVGGEPQDKKYRDQPTRLSIGDGNTIREFVTINRGTAEDEGITRIGDDNWIMAYVHIAHDCLVGSHTIFANAASLAGHCRVDDHAILGGFSLIHQFCQVGAHAFTAMGSVVNRDVPPFVTVAGTYAEPRGINSEGLKRRGYDSARIMAIKRAYKTLYTAGLPLAEARQQLAEAAQQTPDIQQMIDFIDRSQRSLLR